MRVELKLLQRRLKMTTIHVTHDQLEDSGEIRFGGKRVETLEPFARNVGLAFQNYALYPHLNVRGNLIFPLRVR